MRIPRHLGCILVLLGLAVIVLATYSAAECLRLQDTYFLACPDGFRFDAETPECRGAAVWGLIFSLAVLTAIALLVAALTVALTRWLRRRDAYG
jgi:hypothetical protein